MNAKEFVADIISKFELDKNTTQLTRLHYRIKDLIDVSDFKEVSEIFNEIVAQDADPNIVKTALVITKFFKNEATIYDSRRKAIEFIEKKTGRPQL